MRNMQIAMTIGYVCLGTLSAFALLAHVAIAESNFTYEEQDPTGPQHWGDLDPKWILCKTGREQSPITINTILSGRRNSLGQLSLHYVPAQAKEFRDTHVLEVSFGDGNGGNFTLNGEDYFVKQFHFHAPAEHAIDGVRAPLEMHLVHKTKNGQKIAVIGISFTLGAPSPFLDQFWGKLDELGSHDPGFEVDPGLVDLSNQTLKIGPRYARYSGSLTTPPCSQNVTWTVSLQGALEIGNFNTVSLQQLQALKTLLPNSNSRPLQTLFGRIPALYQKPWI